MPLTPFLAIIRKDVQLFFSDRRAVISCAVVCFDGISTAGERVTLIRLAAVASPMTKKSVLGHVDCMLPGDHAGQFIQFQNGQACGGALFVNQSQQLALQRHEILT